MFHGMLAVIDRFHVTSLPPCWRTITKDSSSASIVSSSNMFAMSLSFESLGIDCKPFVERRWTSTSWSRWQKYKYLSKGPLFHADFTRHWLVNCFRFCLRQQLCIHPRRQLQTNKVHSTSGLLFLSLWTFFWKSFIWLILCHAVVGSWSWSNFIL